MKYKVGDKVKFLNSTGGGIISRIIDKSLVHVEIEDGFEVPVMVSDIIHTGTVADPSENLFREAGPADERPSGIHTEANSVRGSIQQGIIPGTFPGKSMEEGLYLAFRPMDQRILTSGDLEVVAINFTGYPLLIQLYLKDGEHFVFNRQLNIPAMRSELLVQIPRGDLDTWLRGAVQFMVQPKRAEALLLPSHTGFHFKGSRFYRADSYENTSLDSVKIISFLLKAATALAQSGQKAEKSTPEKPAEKPQQKVHEPFIKRHLTPDSNAEVDLHIHEIISDHRSLNPMEALSLQMGYFRKALESAISERIPHLIVIHGVGGGILKAEILKEVEELEFAHAFDAPIQKYGVGATVIEFFHTKNR